MVANTIQSLKKLSSAFNSAEIDTLIVISPHMLTYPDRFSICAMKKLFGTFASFGAPDIMTEYQNNLDLAITIDKETKKEEIETLLYNNEGEFFELDHGVMVPLFYLAQNQDSAFKILPLAYSNLSRANHFTYGQIIGKIIKDYPGRIGVIASGDLSHRLKINTQGYSKIGKEFDEKLTNDLEANDVQKILYYDEEFVEEAGECGYRSILILLGILDNFKAQCELLSYEGPFGVGYAVANYKLGVNNG
jgi:aromatic ring-opening dioxygenase LigB subunit